MKDSSGKDETIYRRFEEPPSRSEKMVEPNFLATLPRRNEMPLGITKKVQAVQAEMEPQTPMGKLMIYKDSVIRYITKDQIVGYLKGLMAKHSLACVFTRVEKVELLGIRDLIKGKPVSKHEIRHERFWITYSLLDITDGSSYSATIPADVMGCDAKNSTIAMGFALRDFLSQIFGVTAEVGPGISEEEVAMSDSEPSPVEEKALDGKIRLNAAAAIRRVPTSIFKKAANRAKFAPESTDVLDMSKDELIQALTIAIGEIHPQKESKHLGDVSGEKK